MHPKPKTKIKGQTYSQAETIEKNSSSSESGINPEHMTRSCYASFPLYNSRPKHRHRCRYENGFQWPLIPNTLRESNMVVLCADGPCPGINQLVFSLRESWKKQKWPQNDCGNIHCIRKGFLSLMMEPESFKNYGKGRYYVTLLQDIGNSMEHIPTKQGGYVFGTSRVSCKDAMKKMENIYKNLIELGCCCLVVIGSSAAHKTLEVLFKEEKFRKRFFVVFIPKTINNDFPLSDGVDTLGFSTTLKHCSQIVSGYVADSKTWERYFIIMSHGGSSGILPFRTFRYCSEIDSSCLCIIPEEFQFDYQEMEMEMKSSSLCDLVESRSFLKKDRKKIAKRVEIIGLIIMGMIIKQLSNGKRNGVCILAEGVFHLLRIDHDLNLNEFRQEMVYYLLTYLKEECKEMTKRRNTLKKDFEIHKERYQCSSLPSMDAFHKKETPSTEGRHSLRRSRSLERPNKFKKKSQEEADLIFFHEYLGVKENELESSALEKWDMILEDIGSFGKEEYLFLSRELGDSPRSQCPNIEDIEYARMLGETTGDVIFKNLISSEKSKEMSNNEWKYVEMKPSGEVVSKPFKDIPHDGEDLKRRNVLLTSQHYTSALRRMVRLEPDDFSSVNLSTLALTAGLSMKSFKKKFEKIEFQHDLLKRRILEYK